jgi:spore coat polysaccharide biosynthesis protein SpsF (cytidylyltransferase family)
MDREKHKASIIIQARMGSTRLPGKVMMAVSGKPLIGHMIDRLRQAKLVDRIIVATSTDSSNDGMCDYLKNIGIDVFRGSEDDVLERFYLAAKLYDLKYIVRLTADCPLVDPQIVDRFISEYFTQKADYLASGQTWAEGLDTEVFSFPLLETAYKNARKSSEREHPTLYFHNHPQLFNIVKSLSPTDDSKYRITVDEPQDLEVVKHVFQALYKDGASYFGINEIKSYLDKHPEIYKNNSSIIRNEGLIKSLKADKDIGEQ